jgi:hypothetical protein
VRVDRRRRLAVGACHKMALATKPLPQRGEAILKQSGAYGSPYNSGDGQHAVHHEPDLGFVPQQFYGRRLAGEASMTMVVAFLVCCSAAVFLANAFDAYQAR